MAISADRVCVVIGRTRHKMMMLEMSEAVKRGAKLIELRLDFLSHQVDFKRLLASRHCPLVCTLRRGSDGGRWSSSEDARKMLLRQAIVAGVDWVDLETDIADEIRRFGPTKRIVSYHNLHETPADLESIYERMCKQDADVVKLAVTAQNPGDNLRILNLLKKAPKPTVAHCMGDIGFPSRLLALRYPQVPFIYAALNKERSIAPGMPSLDDFGHVYHADRITSDTQVFGVIGDPVGHSFSPLLHNTAFKHLGVNAVYLPFRVPRGQLTAFLEAFRAVPVNGYSVTIPHKEGAAKAASECDPAVARCQAANTLLSQGDGFTAYNTDYQAVLDSLRAGLPPSQDGTPVGISGRKVLILGAGGVARAAAHALKQAGAELVLTSRTRERAEQLAQEVDGKAVDWMARHSVECDILVHGTPIGMHPNVDESPVHPSFLRPELVVLDTVYNPETTLLIKEARARGCTAITGLDMFIRQAAHQFRLFSGKEPSLDLLRTTLRRAMSPVAALRDEAE